MSDRSGSPSSEGEGEKIRPYGDDPDSSEESEDDDPEEYKRIAEGFIVDEDEGDEGDEGEDETPEERKKRRKEEKRRKRKRDKRLQRERELSDDELELLNENQGYGGSSKNRPIKRVRREEEGGDVDVDADERLQDMFADDEDRLDDDDDDLGDFIEEDEDAGVAGETEEERKARRREEKQKRREAAKLRPDLAGVDRGTWDELFDVFGDGNDYEWALEQEDGEDYREDTEKAKVGLEQVFEPSEIKERRLQREDQVVQTIDRPERHQLLNSTLSEDPVFAPSSPFPDPALAADYAYTKISLRTQYLFCGMHLDGAYHVQNADGYPEYVARRPDLEAAYKAAVAKALFDMFLDNREVPYLYHYRRDTFGIIEEVGRPAVQFLERDELWTLYTLGIKFQAIHERLEQVRTLWRKIQTRRDGLEDVYFDQTLLGNVAIKSIEAAADAMDWLEYHYAAEVRAIKEDEAIEAEAIAASRGEEAPRRRPERQGAREARDGPIMQLVKAFGINVPTVAVDFNDQGGQPHPPVDPVKLPDDLALEFAGPETPFVTPDAALNAAVSILITEFSKDPSIREQAREFAKECSDITITPTDRGMAIIDEYHSYNAFKFLTNKPARNFVNSPQWLHILKAEEEGLVEIAIVAKQDQVEGIVGALERCCRSLDYGEIATAWNALRKDICSRLMTEHLIPVGNKWLKEHLRGQAEDYVAETCRQELEFRVNVRPFATPTMEAGATPSVLALSNGRGEMRDAVIAVYIDDKGDVRHQTKFDNLRDANDREAFINMVMRRKPKVVVIGGMSTQTARLRDDASAALRDLAIQRLDEPAPSSDNYGSSEDYQAAVARYDERLLPYLTPLIVPPDATARMYMDSDEAKLEHPSLPANGKYALALARYAQNPLNAYAKLGRKVLDVTFFEHHQRLVPQEKLLIHLERGLVNSVCAIGLDMGLCVGNPYTRAMLPFVAGLGPRKADILVKTIQREGSTPNRNYLLAKGMAPASIFHNFAGFLTIDHDLAGLTLEEEEQDIQPDPLDCTKIHPEDYEYARKICQDALDLDIEDMEGQHPSEVVLRLMLDDDRARKLSELNMDDFAYNLAKGEAGNKRYVLGEMINEIIKIRADRRPDFYLPSQWEVITMLTGETQQSLSPGMRVTVNVKRVTAARAFCQLESGLDAVLEREYIDGDVASCEDVVHSRQSLKAVIIAAEPTRLQVRISIREDDLSRSVAFLNPFGNDEYNSDLRRGEAEDKAAAKKRRAAGKVKRVVNHPNWHVMNSGQAEQFLASQPRGEVVIRPSSKGSDHLALTFKLDEDVFQHVDVTEIDKPNDYTLGRLLRIGDKYTFGDLDDLIVNYVRAIMRMLEAAERNEKWKSSEVELETSLKNALSAFPDRSMYGFCLDTDKPGFLRLCFLNKSTLHGGQIATWHVRLLPGAYLLGNAEVPGMAELCNAFKAQYSSRLADLGAGGKTPGIRAGRTPYGGRTPGGRTPAVGGMGGQTPYGGVPGGRTPARGMGMGGQTPYGAGTGRTPMRPGMTPNPYGAPGPSRPVNAYGGGATPRGPAGAPAYGYPGPPGAPPPPAGYAPPIPQGYGGMPPPQGPGGARPPPAGGMNPERAAMLARQSGGY